MYKFLLLSLTLFSFNLYANYHYKVLSTPDGQNVGAVCTASWHNECSYLFPAEYAGKPRINNTVYGDGTTLIQAFYNHQPHTGYGSVVYNMYIQKTSPCRSEEECIPLAQSDCQSQGEVLTSFTFIAAGQFEYTCSTSPDPADECQDTVTEMCESNNTSYFTSTYTEDGNGVGSCTGECLDGRSIDDLPTICTPTYAGECDIAEDPSELDFSSGNTGSDLPPSNTTVHDEVNEIPYEPDGTTETPNDSMTQLQGDKLINEVVKSRNDNTTNLTETSDTTNQVIIEKSDDIQNTVSNSANGIIDAINKIPNFYDGNIVDAIESLSDKFSTDVNYTPLEDNDVNNLLTLFSEAEKQHYQSETIDLLTEIETEHQNLTNSITSHLNFSVSANGYQAHNLDLNQWGTHDISLNRLSDYFGGIGNAIYFAAAIAALFIVLGVKR